MTGLDRTDVEAGQTRRSGKVCSADSGTPGGRNGDRSSFATPAKASPMSSINWTCPRFVPSMDGSSRRRRSLGGSASPGRARGRETRGRGSKIFRLRRHSRPPSLRPSAPGPSILAQPRLSELESGLRTRQTRKPMNLKRSPALYLKRNAERHQSAVRPYDPPRNTRREYSERSPYCSSSSYVSAAVIPSQRRR